MVEVPVETWSCPDCGVALLSPDDPRNHEAIDEAIDLRGQLVSRPRWRIAAGFLAFLGVVIGAVLTGSGGMGRLAGTAVAVVGFSVVIPVLIRRRMSPRWRELLERRKRRP